MVFFMYPPVLGREGCKNTPPAGSDFALRASQGQSRIFAPLTSFSTYDSYEAPYENTARSLDKINTPPARSASPFGLRRAKVGFFTYPVPFLTNDKCEAPYENTALSLDK